MLLDRDGELKRLEVKGEFQVCVYDPDVANIKIHTNGPLKKTSGFKFYVSFFDILILTVNTIIIIMLTSSFFLVVFTWCLLLFTCRS